MKNKVTFIAKISGDGECFLWSGVSEEDKIGVVGAEDFETDRKLEEETCRETCQMRGVEFEPKLVQAYLEQLYPGDVMRALGVERDKKYKFTVTAEKMREEENERAETTNGGSDGVGI